MMFILLKNKENFESVACATVEKFFAVIQQNNPSPFGLPKKSLLALSKRLPVDDYRRRASPSESAIFSGNATV